LGDYETAMSSSQKNKGKRFHIEFSGTSAFFGTLICLFFLAWIFFLGILAGGGYFADGLDAVMDRILHQEKRKAGDVAKVQSHSNPTKKLDNEPSFEFYKKLSERGEEKKDLPYAKVRANEPGREGPARSTESARGYTVQVAALGSESQALKMVNQLVRKGHEAFFYKTIIQGKAYFRVMCGKFKSRKEADALQKLLARRENMTKSFVTRVLEE
jgi:hypothetical protein